MQRTDPLRGEANRSLATLAPLGFTLVEVMVALAVVAVEAGMILFVSIPSAVVLYWGTCSRLVL